MGDCVIGRRHDTVFDGFPDRVAWEFFFSERGEEESVESVESVVVYITCHSTTHMALGMWLLWFE